MSASWGKCLRTSVVSNSDLLIMATINDKQLRPTPAENDEEVKKNGEENVENGEDGGPTKEISQQKDEPENTPAKSADSGDATSASTSVSPTPWQAVYAPQYNTYYFYNTETQETTWENPLSSASASTSDPSSSSQPPEASDSTTPAGTSTYISPHAALEAAALAAGINPSLAHLDPTLLASIPSSSGASTSGLPPAFTAKFNARTGQFARPDARDPTHLSEHARAARMSEFYFDVNAWEQQLASQGGSIMGGEEEGKKRKRPSKKDLVRPSHLFLGWFKALTSEF
ncbi:hypothetical protein DXG03_005661, partial [Asterophora parasitica]